MHRPRVRLRSRAVLLGALAAALTAGAAAAPALALTVGIADNKPDMFGDPRFHAAGVRFARLSVGWDALSSPWQVAEIDAWLGAARAANVEPLVSFGHSRTDRRSVPTPERFLFEFRRFRARYPWVKEYAAWNEANHCGEPTCHKARRVARFYNNMRHNCYGCTVVAGDVLDTPTMPAWVREFRRTARKDKLIWGLHNYIDANRFRTKGTKALLKAAPKGKIWFTETGGLVVRRNKSRIAFPGNKKHQVKATKQVFKLARLSPRVRRIYFYHWQPSADPLPTWDSALVDPRGKPRPAYSVLKRYVVRFAREAARRAEEGSPTEVPAGAEGMSGAKRQP